MLHQTNFQMNFHNYYFEPLPKLELDKNRFRVKHCPCGKSNKDGKFVPYKGHEDFGYCHSCGEAFLPKIEKPEQWQQTQPKLHRPQPKPKPVSFTPVDLFKQSLQTGKTVLEIAAQNHFIKYLVSLFGEDVTAGVIAKYYIGTSKHWQGANVFWQVDASHKIRTGKIMLYNPDTGKRVKEPYSHANWVHSVYNMPEFDLQQCFFGEHLLTDKTKPVFVFEAEKTAIIASVFFPNIICIATGGKDGLNTEKCKVLQGRNVTLWPDLNAFDLWSEKAKQYGFVVSKLIQQKASEQEKQQGFDLADYLIKLDIKEFTQPETIIYHEPQHQIKQVETIEPEQNRPLPTFANRTITNHNEPKKEDWSKQIQDLQNYFAGITLPQSPVKLNQCTTILDCSTVIKTHLATLENYNGNKTFAPYMERLQTLKNITHESRN